MKDHEVQSFCPTCGYNGDYLSRHVAELETIRHRQATRIKELEAQIAMLVDALNSRTVTGWFRGSRFADSLEEMRAAIHIVKPTADAFVSRIKAEAAPQWQPIETAPNEYGIDVWIVSLDNPDFGARVAGVHRVGARWFGIPDYYLTDRVFPAYWMPLPAAPTSAKERSE